MYIFSCDNDVYRNYMLYIISSEYDDYLFAHKRRGIHKFDEIQVWDCDRSTLHCSSLAVDDNPVFMLLFCSVYQLLFDVSVSLNHLCYRYM